MPSWMAGEEGGSEGELEVEGGVITGLHSPEQGAQEQDTTAVGPMAMCRDVPRIAYTRGGTKLLSALGLGFDREQTKQRGTI